MDQVLLNSTAVVQGVCHGARAGGRAVPTTPGGTLRAGGGTEGTGGETAHDTAARDHAPSLDLGQLILSIRPYNFTILPITS